MTLPLDIEYTGICDISSFMLTQWLTQLWVTDCTGPDGMCDFLSLAGELLLTDLSFMGWAPLALWFHFWCICPIMITYLPPLDREVGVTLLLASLLLLYSPAQCLLNQMKLSSEFLDFYGQTLAAFSGTQVIKTTEASTCTRISILPISWKNICKALVKYKSSRNW